MRLLIIVSAVAIAALGCDCDCASDSDQDFDAGTGDAGGDTDSETGEPCPDPIADECDPAYEDLPLLVEAAAFGEGTTFVAAAPETLLAERDDDDTRTITVIDCPAWSGPCAPENAATAQVAVPISSGMHGTAVAVEPYENDLPLPSHVALLCAADDCALFGAWPDESGAELLELEGGTVPAGAEPTGLWWGPDSAPVCAYGNGIHCFDGGDWTSPVAAVPGNPLLNEMVGFGTGVLAVGDQGRVVQSGFPHWSDGFGPGNPDWNTVVPYGGYTVAGEGGAWASSSWWDWCFVCDQDIAALEQLRYFTGLGLSYTQYATVGVTTSGAVFVGEGVVPLVPGMCFTGQVVDWFVEAVSFFCGASVNLWLVGADALYGTVDCSDD